MFCKNCGSKVADDALFCEQCGTAIRQAEVPVNEPVQEEAAQVPVQETVEVLESAPVVEPIVQPDYETEAEPGSPVQNFVAAMRKIPVKVLIPVAGAAVLGIIALIIILTVGGNGGVDPDSFYHEMNYNNGGRFAYDSERLYFVAEYDEDAEDPCLYSTDYKGINKRKISESSDILNIRVIDGRIYFEESLEEGYRLGVMNTDGSDVRTIFKNEDGVDKYAVYGDRIYYDVDDVMFVCTVEGEDERQLFEGCETFVIGKGVIYFVTPEDVIKVYDIKKETTTELCKAVDGFDLALDGNTLYFTCETGLSKVDVKSGEVTTVIKDSELTSYIFHGDYIYYGQYYDDETINNFAEYLADTSSEVSTYKLVLMLTGEFHRANRDGSDAHAVEDANITIVYALYTCPEDIYYEMSIFLDEVSPVTFGED